MSWTAASGGADVTDGTAPLRIIAGPTAAGKSALARQLAEAHDATIISADSRQVYRGFDIGTAKPTAEERGRVPHRGIDLVEPTERYSAARWAADADGWLAGARESGRPALIVGGTGLWLRALVHPLADEPPMDPVRRAVLAAELAGLDTPTLREQVRQLDPARAHLGRTQLLRAAEVALLTGTRISDWHAAGADKPRRPARWLIVDPGPVLHERIAARIDAMLSAGWADEVRDLITRVPGDAPAWNACGYREIREWVEGTDTPGRTRPRTRDEMRAAILVSTRQYAKRQRTWFRNQLGDEADVTRLDPRDAGAERIAARWYSARTTGEDA